jgi:hypothetical protein
MRLLTGFKAIAAVLMMGAIVTIDLGELTQPASALPTEGTLVAQARRRRLGFRTGVRASRFRVGGFSRGGECGSQQAITALVPPPQAQERLSDKKAAVDKTAVARPTFFVALPALPEGSAQFTLQDEAGRKQLHSVSFKLTGKAGIVGVTLPESAPALQVGQKYFWQMAVACDPDQPSKLSVISSWVERVPTPAARDERITTLAEQGIWYDVAALVGLQRFQQPSDRALGEDWATLMQDAGLGQFKQTAIVQIVKK